MAEVRAEVTRRRRISAIWIVPLVAVVLGAWMVWFTFRNEGPEITIVFSTAEGIEAGKTKVRARSVEIGLVSSVGLADDLESVVVVAELDKSAEKLLREGTEFWVVRARVGAGGVTGLGTILSGGYIELAPGTGKKGRRKFQGLEDVPVTPVGTPGLRLTLVSDQARSVGAGDPILYDGYRVGRVETADFDVGSREMRYDAFIEAPYDTLVTTGTRFWNASGVHFSATADGVEFSTGSLQSLLLGGVTFGVPESADPGTPAASGALFTLYPKEPSAQDREYRESIEYVVQFARSVRGLRPGAPVEYRGLHAGRVERIMLSELVQETDGSGNATLIPVLITLQPGRLELGDDAEGRARLAAAIERGVGTGMRATLASGSLLTGSLYVALDRYDTAPAEALGTFAGRPTIPTIASGIEGIEHQVSALLDRLNALPLDDLAGAADETLHELTRTVAALNAVIQSEGVQSLPDQLELTLAELDRTLRRVSDLAASLEAEPSSLLFSREPVLDPEPAAGAP
jgi:paraquat-inducible protein B